MGMTHQRMPRLLTVIFWERATNPWNSSCSTTAMISATIPYPSGMIGLIPGIPSAS